LYVDTFSESLGQVGIWRLSGQGQGHRRKKREISLRYLILWQTWHSHTAAAM